MEKYLESYLEKCSITYKEYSHKPVFTVEESRLIKEKIPAVHTKCLFLKDDSSRFYLVAIQANKRLDIKLLKSRFLLKKLFFASPEELKENLNLTPGSVSIFGMINAKNVRLIIDNDLYNAESVGFHPNLNTSTLVLDNQNLKRFLSSLNINIEIMQL